MTRAIQPGFHHRFLIRIAGGDVLTPGSRAVADRHDAIAGVAAVHWTHMSMKIVGRHGDRVSNSSLIKETIPRQRRLRGCRIRTAGTTDGTSVVHQGEHPHVAFIHTHIHGHLAGAAQVVGTTGGEEPAVTRKGVTILVLERAGYHNLVDGIRRQGYIRCEAQAHDTSVIVDDARDRDTRIEQLQTLLVYTGCKLMNFRKNFSDLIKFGKGEVVVYVITVATIVSVDLLSGVLTGSGFLSAVHSPYQTSAKSNCGHLIVAMNIEAFQPLGQFQKRMEKFIREIKSVPLATGHDEVFYPGEIEANNDLRHRRDGLLLAKDTMTGLKRIGKETGLNAKLPF